MSNPRIEVDFAINVSGVANGVAAATSQLDKLGNAAKATAPKVDALTESNRKYNAVGVDFARLIQDAPFGIIGYGNNITQLAQSFSGLGKETDTFSSRFKLALGAIFSSGNLLILGVSALTTALTILSQKGFFQSEESVKSLNDRLEEYRENLEGVSKATLEGSINAGKEISTLKLLQTQAENTNLSIEKRLAAVGELKKQYPEYLQNLTDEQILAGNVGDAYKSLTTDILSLAKAKAFSAQIDKNTAATLTLLLQEEERAVLISQKRQDLERARREDEQRRALGTAAGGVGSAAISEARSIESEINSLVAETVKSSQERVKLAEQNLKLEAGIVDFSSQGASFAKIKTEETKKNVKENENLKKTFQDISDLDFFVETAGAGRRGAFFEDIEKQLTSIESGVASTRGIYTENVAAITKSNEQFIASLQGSGISIEQFYAAIANGAAEGFSSLETFVSSLAQTQQFINETFQILEQGAENTIGDVAFAIGDALGSGGNVLKAAGSALLGGIAGILNQLGQLAIATGLAVEGIKKALQTLNPAVAIGAGVALVALAGFVSSKAKSLGGSRGGGGGGGSSVGSSGVGGGSEFVGTGAQGGMFASQRDLNGELVVRGQDLVYVFGQANNRINKG